MLQDHRGFIWIGGSNYGLQRYDGYEFVNYDQFTSPILYLDEDRKGLLWLGTDNGFYVMNPENEKFLHYEPLTSGKSSDNRVFKVIEDRNGNYWCATLYNVFKMEPKVKEGERIKDLIFKNGIDSVFTFTRFAFPRPDSLLWATYEIFEDSRGLIWAGGPQGLFIFDSKQGKFIYKDVFDPIKSEIPTVITILE